MVEIFCGPEVVEKLLYYTWCWKNQTALRWRLKGFAKIQAGSCHAPGHTRTPFKIV